MPQPKLPWALITDHDLSVDADEMFGCLTSQAFGPEGDEPVGIVVTKGYGPNADARHDLNLETILTSVNSKPELVKALREAHAYIKTQDVDSEGEQAVLKSITFALKQAKETL